MIVARLEAAYFLFMGIWPLLHLKSFEAVTGPKTDKWLVKSIAWLFIIIGVQIWVSSHRPEIAVLGIGAAAVIGGADVYYSLVKRRISRIYLFDVIPQFLFIMGWLIYLLV